MGQQNESIVVEATVQLKYPFSNSLTTLFGLSNVQNFKILSSSSTSPLVKVEFPWEVFKKLFNTNPKVGSYNAPKGSESFIDNVKVTSVKGK